MYLNSPSLEDSLTSSDEAKRIEERQIQEDVKLFGVRSVPMDTEISTAAPEEQHRTYERSTPNIQPSADVLSKRKHAVAATALDWNSGATPIDAWLNQSAVPVGSPGLTALEVDQYTREKEARKLEEQELMFYRKVHLDTEVQGDKSHSRVIEDVESTGLAAQVYRRNIMDRYPSIPPYLARRLAEANVKRAERLAIRTVQPEDVPTVAKDRDNSIGTDEDRSLPPIFHRASEDLENAAMLSDAPFLEDLWVLPRSEQIEIKSPRPSLPTQDLELLTNMENPELDEFESLWRELEQLPSLQAQPPPSESFWTGGAPRRRSASVHSAFSSMNSELRGDRADWDEDEQDLHFSESLHDSEKLGGFRPTPGLPPPPVQLGLEMTFECDICKLTVRVERRKEWQYVHGSTTPMFTEADDRQGSRFRRSQTIHLYGRVVRSSRSDLCFPN
jgi:hypothetical protein